MKVSDTLNVQVDNGGALVSVVQTRGHARMAFIGASCNASALPGSNHIKSVSIAPKKGNKAVVALYIYHEVNKQSQSTRQFFVLYWQGEKLVVDLDTEFVPGSERLCQLDNENHILVTTRGQRFVAVFPHCLGKEHTNKWKQEFIDKGCRLVEPETLCRYIVGDISFEDLEAVATMDRRFLCERENAKLAVELSKTVEALTVSQTAEKKFCLELKKCEQARVTNSWALAEKTKEVTEAQKRYRELDSLVNDIACCLYNVGDEIRSFFGFLPVVKLVKIRKLIDRYRSAK